MTNGDKVRRATDEELVDLWYFIYNNVIFSSTDSCQGLYQWLKQEVCDD